MYFIAVILLFPCIITDTYEEAAIKLELSKFHSDVDEQYNLLLDKYARKLRTKKRIASSEDDDGDDESEDSKKEEDTNTQISLSDFPLPPSAKNTGKFIVKYE